MPTAIGRAWDKGRSGIVEGAKANQRKGPRGGPHAMNLHSHPYPPRYQLSALSVGAALPGPKVGDGVMRLLRVQFEALFAG